MAEERLEFGTARVEAFSDAVLAVIITIMALNLRTPAGTDVHALSARFPEFAVYVLSYSFLGIYWNNHHHLMRVASRVSGVVMWANLFLLFWLSLIPVLTNWVASSWRAPLPAASWGVCALAASLAGGVLIRAVIAADAPNGRVAAAIGRDYKWKVSVATYTIGVAFAAVTPWISYGCYAAVSIMWFIPDRRLLPNS